MFFSLCNRHYVTQEMGISCRDEYGNQSIWLIINGYFIFVHFQEHNKSVITRQAMWLAGMLKPLIHSVCGQF
ncbi:MAG: hypothetical protein JKY01_06330 [Pseudomonadales bacterium]|nr:hypothetical protein [Pseudomonadales bacterium]